jgi:hypothetical protein
MGRRAQKKRANTQKVRSARKRPQPLAAQAVSTVTLERQKLAPAGTPSDLYVVAHGVDQNAEALLNDTSEREFDVWCTFSKGATLTSDLTLDNHPTSGESFFRFPEDTFNPEIHGGGCRFRLHRNAKGEFSGVAARIRANASKDARAKFLTALSPVLDHWSYLGNTPIVVRTVLCEDPKNAITMMSFITPYADLTLNPGGGELRVELLPLYGLYREAKNASSPFYRFLCYFKILEAVYSHLRPKVFGLARQNSFELVKKKEVVPEHPELLLSWKSYIGRPIKDLMDKELEPQYRNAVAHFLLDQGGAPLNPSDAETVAKFGNMLLVAEVCARVVIDQQADYYRQIDEEARRRAADGAALPSC